MVGCPSTSRPRPRRRPDPGPRPASRAGWPSWTARRPTPRGSAWCGTTRST
ncbi:hypothetical protein [Ornithinimicrobium kibberense]|uniref:hypothetical protein n=1 Tax=Ornithinimicrobium kibberense TaxID=282060 RepID=UPI00362209CA